MKLRHAGALVACTIIAWTTGATEPAPAADAEIAKQIRILEGEEVRAVLAHDAATLDRLWDKGYVVHNPEGRIVPAGASVMDRPVLQSNRASFARDVESVVVNGDVVFSMGSETVAPRPGEVVKRRYTNVWMLKKGAWKLVARHANRVCQ